MPLLNTPKLQEEWQEFLIGKGICPICETDENVFNRGIDRVCTQCGLVLESYREPSHHVPGVGNNTSYAPEGPLSFGSDKGNLAVTSAVDRFALHRVLGHAGKENLGIRVIQTKSECAIAEECSRIRAGLVTRRMKMYVSGWLKNNGWREEVEFAHRIGRNINWMGGLCDLVHDGRHCRNLSAGLLVWDAQKWFGAKDAVQIMECLKVKGQHIEVAKQMVQLRRVVQSILHTNGD